MQRFLTNNPSFLNSKSLIPTGIVVHSTGVNLKNIDVYFNQFNKTDKRASVHGIIGLKNGELVYEQWLPYDIQCWGCGSGPKGSYNRSHIQIEIAEDTTDKEWTLKTYAKMLEVCTELTNQFNISSDNVVCHSEAHKLGYGSNHADVMHWWPKYGLSMDKFRKELGMTKEQILETLDDRWIERFDDLPEWAKSDVRELLDKGVINGGTSKEVDPDDINMALSDLKVVIICKRLLSQKN